MLSFFPLDVLDEIWDLIESVSEGFLTYSLRQMLHITQCIFDELSTVGPQEKLYRIFTALMNVVAYVVMSGRSVSLATLFLGRFRPPKRLTSTLCTHFRQLLTTALLESVEGDTTVYVRTGYRTQDPCILSQMRYQLRHAARRAPY